MTDTCRQYDRIAARYDATRSKHLMERGYLEPVAASLPAGGEVLDVGCGSGEPIARYLVEAGYRVTGIDGAPGMVAMCRERFPDMEWIVGDMRTMTLGRAFDVVIAWDSFFHLAVDDQRAMFPIFRDHVAGGGMLLFTSGHEAGEITNEMHGEAIFHASLSPDEYRALLDEHSFDVISYTPRDPDCGEHTVWLARRRIV
jgi:cyclopropane fatty-acyl-phospholipid synthase-like methyltransferase